MKIIKKYQSLLLFIGGFLIAYLLFNISLIKDFFLGLGNFGYIGALLGGLMFAYSLTVGIGVAILFTLAKSMSPLTLSLVAGFGAMLGDLLVFNLVRKKLKTKISKFYNLLDKKSFLRKILDNKKFNWILPLFGLLIIASPFPDELGVALVGESKMEESHFKLIAFLMNAIGIYILIGMFK